MKLYRLTNKDRPNQILSIFDKLFAINDYLQAVEKAPKIATKILGIFSEDVREHDIFLKSVKYIKECQNKNTDTILNHYLSDRYLSFDEASFCLLGLHPKAIQLIDKNFKKPTTQIKGVILKLLLLDLAEVRGLSKASRIGELDGFISDEEDKVYTEGLIKWAIKNKYIFIEELPKDANPQAKDAETNILLSRLTIYQLTLPKFLKNLKEPTSIRRLSILSDNATEGEYAIQYKHQLGGISGDLIRKELGRLFKSSWWNSQPEQIKLKLIKSHK